MIKYPESISPDELPLFLENFERVLGKAGINLDIIDSKLNVRYVDPSWQKIYGNPRGKKCYQYFMGKSKACLRCGVAKALATKKIIVTEEVLLREGSRPIQITTVPFKNKKGERLVAEVNVNISERKTAEEVLKRDKEALERLVSDRTSEVLRAERELNRSRRLADIGALAAIVAHELRNPLAAIRMASYNVRAKSKDNALYSHLSNIDTMVQECSQIINNLLLYSHIKEPKLKKIKVCHIMHECIIDVKERFSKQNVKIVRSGDCPEDFYINADPVQVREVFNNILNNAYDSFEGRGGKIVISGGIDKRGHLAINFKDNGIGITASDLDRIFEPFFTKKAKGTGLGLVVCRQIMDMHNGAIEVRSKPSKGTTVTVSFPPHNRKK